MRQFVALRSRSTYLRASARTLAGPSAQRQSSIHTWKIQTSAMSNAADDAQLASILAALPSLSPDALKQVVKAAKQAQGTAWATANLQAFKAAFSKLVRGGSSSTSSSSSTSKRADIVKQYQDMLSSMKVVEVSEAQAGTGHLVKLSVPWSDKLLAVSSYRDDFRYAAGASVGIQHTLLVCYDQKRITHWDNRIFCVAAFEPDVCFKEPIEMRNHEQLSEIMQTAGFGDDEGEQHLVPFLCAVASPLGDSMLHDFYKMEEWCEEECEWFEYPRLGWGAPHGQLFCDAEEDEEEE